MFIIIKLIIIIIIIVIIIISWSAGVSWSSDDARWLIHSPFNCNWSGAGPKSLSITLQQHKNVAVSHMSCCLASSRHLQYFRGIGFKWVWSRVQYNSCHRYLRVYRKGIGNGRCYLLINTFAMVAGKMHLRFWLFYAFSCRVSNPY